MTQTKHVTEATQDDFQQAVLEESHRRPVLADFWAAWCNPCKILIPLLEKLAQEYQGQFMLAKVDTDKERELSDHYAIRTIPTVILFSKGEEITRFNGVISEQEIRALIDAVIPDESDMLLDKAEVAFGSGEQETGLALAQQAMAHAPGKYRIAVRAAALMMDQRLFAEADQVLKSLPIDRQMDPSITPMLARLAFAEVIRNAPGATELARDLEQNPRASETAYRLAAHKVLAGDHEAAMQLLLEILRHNPQFGDGAARKAMVRIFEILGNSGELVQRYRMEMARLLH